MSNVKKGDLAYVTGDVSRENNGRTVEVLGLKRTTEHGPYWTCVCRHAKLTACMGGSRLVEVPPGVCVVIPDAMLRPIGNPGDALDEDAEAREDDRVPAAV
jgi:hypothetical protein